jgi:hypothetical protein
MGDWENDIVMADFNGDGLPDLAEVGQDSIDVYLAQANGGYARTQSIPMPGSDTASTSTVCKRAARRRRPRIHPVACGSSIGRRS